MDHGGQANTGSLECVKLSYSHWKYLGWKIFFTYLDVYFYICFFYKKNILLINTRVLTEKSWNAECQPTLYTIKKAIYREKKNYRFPELRPELYFLFVTHFNGDLYFFLFLYGLKYVSFNILMQKQYFNNVKIFWRARRNGNIKITVRTILERYCNIEIPPANKIYCY